MQLPLIRKISQNNYYDVQCQVKDIKNHVNFECVVIVNCITIIRDDV